MKEADNNGQSGDCDVPKSSTSLSPVSSQDLNSDMPVSSSFSWSGESTQHSSHTSRNGLGNNSNSSSGNITSAQHGSLAEWTIFPETSHNPFSSSSSNDPHNILKELLKDEHEGDANEGGTHALLKQILNEKPNNPADESSKQLRLLLGGEPTIMSNGSPTNHNSHDANTYRFVQNISDLTNNNPQPLKRKIEEIDGANPGNVTKLSESNKLLAGLLQSTPRQPLDVSPAGLPAPNPGDLPQNKLPKDLVNRILSPPGPRKTNSYPSGPPLNDYLMDNNSLFRDQMDQTLYDLVAELQDSDLGNGEPAMQSVSMIPANANEKQAIDNIRQQLLQDLPNGMSMQFSHESISFNEQTIASPGGPMGPRYSMNSSPGMVRAPPQQLHNFTGGADSLMFQRMPGGHMMLPQGGLPPRPGGGVPSDFTASRSPVPSSPSHVSQNIRANLRQQSWNKIRAQQLNSNQQQPSMQMSNGPPPNVTLQRSVSIPSPGGHFPVNVNGFQNVPQNSPQFLNQQQSVPYNSPPPQTMRFPVQNPSHQPLSPRHPNAQPGRLVRPNMQWMQSQGSPISGMGSSPSQPSPHPMHGNGPMSVSAQQQNPPPYMSQQFVNQNNGQAFPQHQQMMQQNANQARFQGPGGGGGPQASQFSQQSLIQQQQDVFGNPNSFYSRGSAPGLQQRMQNPGQNPMMRTNFVNNLSDDMRPNDGFGTYQMNGTVSSAPPNINSQQSQFRWDNMPGTDRMSMSSAPGGMNSSNAPRMSAPNIDPAFEQFDSYFQDPIPNGLGGHPGQNQHLSEQQFRYSNDSQSLVNQLQHSNQQFASVSSCGDLMNNGHPGNSPGHQMMPPTGSNSTSLLQKLLSENG